MLRSHLPAFPTGSLEEALPFLNGLLRLGNLIILADQDQPTSMLDCAALGSLVARISHLELKGAQIMASCGNTLILGSLGDLLLPWHTSLTSLHVETCFLSTSRSNPLNSPGLFSKLPCLSLLSLIDLLTPQHPSTSLDLAGCTALQELVCSDINLISLDVTACALLSSLDCSQPPDQHGVDCLCQSGVLRLRSCLMIQSPHRMQHHALVSGTWTAATTS